MARGSGPLRNAASNGELDRITRLLAEGVAVDDVNQHGFTALLLASRNGHVSAVRALLAAGAAADHRAPGGFTPFTVAAACGHIDVVDAILDHGPVGRDLLRQSLGWAILTRNLALVRRLLRAGANPLDANSKGRSALEYAAEQLANPAVLPEYRPAYADIVDLLRRHIERDGPP